MSEIEAQVEETEAVVEETEAVVEETEANGELHTFSVVIIIQLFT